MYMAYAHLDKAPSQITEIKGTPPFNLKVNEVKAIVTSGDYVQVYGMKRENVWDSINAWCGRE